MGRMKRKEIERWQLDKGDGPDGANRREFDGLRRVHLETGGAIIMCFCLGFLFHFIFVIAWERGNQ